MGKKRFACRDYKINYSIQCEEISDNGDWITYGQIVDLLNTFNDENEQLKMKNDNLISLTTRVQVINDKLKEENEQLKEEIKGLNDVLARYEEKELERMTEKRFYCKKDGINQWCISDRLNQYPMPITSLEFCSIVANALNGLWSQTQRFEKHNQRLEKENEQLKQDNKEYIRGLDLSKATTQSWASDVRELREQNCQLEKENDQLRKELKRCKEWLNSDKYDYETTLAFIKSKGFSLKDVLKYKGDNK